MTTAENVSEDPRYPEGEALKSQLNQRQRRGQIWRTAFVAATLVGILALIALLYNVINSAFGYVAIQNTKEPNALVLSIQEEALLGATNLISSENDRGMINRVASRPNAVGFFGYSYYQNRADELKVLSIDGVTPSLETAESGEYLLARPLFIYSAPKVLEEKPHVAEFMRFYLENVNNIIEDVGYFAASPDLIDVATAQLSELTLSEESLDENSISMAGSSTVYPLSEALSNKYTESGFSGEISIESIGSKAGLARFCSGAEGVDIANASRTITRAETEFCRRNRLTPLEFRVGNDAIAVVVSAENDFVDSLTLDELRLLFTTAETWADVNPDWPVEPIERLVPSIDSGTLDFFTETVFDATLEELPRETLMAILEANLSAGLIRRFESEIPFAERTDEDILNLVYERVVEPRIVRSWTLYDSLFSRDAIATEVDTIPQSTMVFRNWLTTDFLTSPQSSTPDQAGIRTAILGSLWVILITILFSLPLGVGASIYLEEYATDNWFNRIIETNINNLAGVPSIIYGMLGLSIFVRVLESLTSGTFFGAVEDPTTANGRTVLSAGLTLGLLILPIIIINAREAIRAVPGSLRQASYGLGATKWQTIWNHVLPSALPGILTGNILAMSRAIGETAPLVVIGASTFIVTDPNGPFAKFTTLPIQIYQWTARPQDEFRNIAAAAIIVLLLLLLTLNASAVLLRNRYSNQL
ncbi:MAG: phosphate ABC transporter permease PstA [Chloroflexota bacterium]